MNNQNPPSARLLSEEEMKRIIHAIESTLTPAECRMYTSKILDHIKAQEKIIEEQGNKSKELEIRILGIASDHYWDSMSQNKQTILQHLEFIVREALASSSPITPSAYKWTEERLQELTRVNQEKKIPRYFAIKKLVEDACTHICGDANPKGNIQFTFKGGCRGKLPIEEAYRCTGCAGWFHRNCIFEHFEQEEGHSKAYNALRKIKDYVTPPHIGISFGDISTMCDEGLDRTLERKSFFVNKND